MKKSIFSLLLLLAATTAGFAENLVLENQTSYPMKSQKAKLAIQWASSAKEVQEGNEALIQDLKLNPSKLQVLSQPGKVTITIPKTAEYFRVVVWSKGEGNPDLLTNWVDIVPNKTYTLKEEHLVPSVLMIGMGC